MDFFRKLFIKISRIPPTVLLAAIVGIAFVVTWMVTSKISTDEQSFTAKEKALNAKYTAKATVVYALRDVPEGETIPSDALEERQVEQSKCPEDALTSASLATGRVTKYGVSAGAIVSQHDLQPQGQASGTSFDAKLQPGYRAVTFAVDNNSGVAGFIEPQSHIDIVGMVGSGAETKAKPILSDVEVIAVGQTFQRKPGASYSVPASSITVAVTAEDSTKLIKGVLASKLYLSLRNSTDHSPVATVDVTSLFAAKSVETGMGGYTPSEPRVSMVPPPPPSAGDDLPLPKEMDSAAAPAPSEHQIEAWSGSKKNILVVPQN
jgi:Flp pilus assembly protein CpaB